MLWYLSGFRDRKDLRNIIKMQSHSLLINRYQTQVEGYKLYFLRIHTLQNNSVQILVLESDDCYTFESVLKFLYKCCYQGPSINFFNCLTILMCITRTIVLTPQRQPKWKHANIFLWIRVLIPEVPSYPWICSWAPQWRATAIFHANVGN